MTPQVDKGVLAQFAWVGEGPLNVLLWLPPCTWLHVTHHCDVAPNYKAHLWQRL